MPIDDRNDTPKPHAEKDLVVTNLLGTHFTISEHPLPDDPDNTPLFPDDHPAHQRVTAAAAAERRAAHYHYVDFDEMEERDAEEEALRRQHEVPGDPYRMEY